MNSRVPRFQFPVVYADPAFIRCVDAAINDPEFVENFDRLAGTTLCQSPSKKDMRHFVEHVHDAIYMRISDDAIAGLRGEWREV